MKKIFNHDDSVESHNPLGYINECKCLEETIIGGGEVLMNTSVIPSLDIPKVILVKIFHGP